MRELFEAILAKDVDKVRELVQANPDAVNSVDLVNSLSGGSNFLDLPVNCTPAFYVILLVYAERYNNIYDSVVARGQADLDMRYEYVESIQRIRGDYREILKIILSSKKIDINSTYQHSGKTLLHYLANDEEFRKILINKNINIAHRDRRGHTAFDQLLHFVDMNDNKKGLIGSTVGLWFSAPYFLLLYNAMPITNVLTSTVIAIPFMLCLAGAKALYVYAKARSLDYNRSDSLHESFTRTYTDVLRCSSALATGAIGAMIVGTVITNPFVTVPCIIASGFFGEAITHADVRSNIKNAIVSNASYVKESAIQAKDTVISFANKVMSGRQDNQQEAYRA